MTTLKFSKNKLIKIISNDRDTYFILHSCGLSELIFSEFLNELKTRKTFDIWDLRKINDKGF